MLQKLPTVRLRLITACPSTGAAPQSPLPIGLGKWILSPPNNASVFGVDQEIQSMTSATFDFRWGSGVGHGRECW